MSKSWEELCARMDETTKKMIQSHEDKRVADAIETYKKNHPDDNSNLKSLIERLTKLEAAKVNIEKRFELKATALQLCHDNNIPFNMIEDQLNNLPDENAIRNKISSLKEFANDLEKRNTNELLSKGFKPNAASSDRNSNIDLGSLEPEAVVELELSGQLDKVLKAKKNNGAV